MSLFKLFICLIILGSFSCNSSYNETKNSLDQGKSDSILVSDKNFLNDFPPIALNGKINVVVEIPCGTNAKWEVNKNNGNIELEKENNIFREIQYLSYPGNYGFIPNTLLSKESGGDGDPLDVIILAPSIPRGEVIECDIIGVLKIFDNQEQDDKLIAVCENSPFKEITTSL
ncbi:inorganic diphosphatase, partial [Bacteroidota bacterium]